MINKKLLMLASCVILFPCLADARGSGKGRSSIPNTSTETVVPDTSPTIVPPTVITPPTTISAFNAGIADRTSYENWFSTLDDTKKQGAAYWADQRSNPHPGS